MVTLSNLQSWANRLREVNNSLGDSLAEYANAWSVDVSYWKSVVDSVTSGAVVSSSEGWAMLQYSQLLELEYAKERCKTLEKTLAEAIKSIECEWAPYASKYFQEKHKLQEELDRYRAVLNSGEVP